MDVDAVEKVLIEAGLPPFCTMDEAVRTIRRSRRTLSRAKEQGHLIAFQGRPGAAITLSRRALAMYLASEVSH